MDKTGYHGFIHEMYTQLCFAVFCCGDIIFTDLFDSLTRGGGYKANVLRSVISLIFSIVKTHANY